ncbi:hypothetical protein [Nocardia mexicana]|uniref:Uncharacterized protein n=1 Tax=Nocardia mexicana TaxID=279262 RepID=A0A370H4N0_9NOCA|nr:hypothetical protein [Nocardia mexicana]RDI51126.1 hypothetical protein DFR68_105604 [Nocardia mexicana]
MSSRDHPAELLEIRPVAPTFAEYLPKVRARVAQGTLGVYDTRWKRIERDWGTRRLDEPTVGGVTDMRDAARRHAKRDRNSRDGRGAAEAMVSALRCMYKHAENDGVELPWVEKQQISIHWIRHTTLTWVERKFSFAVARAYAGHVEPDSRTGRTHLRNHVAPAGAPWFWLDRFILWAWSTIPPPRFRLISLVVADGIETVADDTGSGGR